jgi:hypothetical protein
MLVYSLAFSLTFFYPGFHLAGIIINIPLVLVLLLDFYILLKCRFNQKNLFFIIIFFLWSFFGVVFRYPILSYLPSLVFSMSLILPLCVSWKTLNIDVEKMLNYMVLGAFISFLFIPFELYFRYMKLFGYTGNELWLNISGHSVRLFRASALMMEPSHFTVLLTLIYVTLDIAESRGYSIKHFILFRYCYFVTLILSVSLSGIVLFVLYYAIKFIRFIFKNVVNDSKILINKRIVVYTVSGIIFLVLINILSNNYIGHIAKRVFERVIETRDVVKKQKSVGSSGERASFIWASKIYLENSSVQNVIIGDGFSNYHQWLAANSKRIGYSTGEVYNLYFVVLLSVGLIGLLWFVLMILSLTDTNYLDFGDVAFLIILLCSFLTHAYLIMYWVWVPILLFRLTKKESV